MLVPTLGHVRRGRGKPIKKIGRQKRGKSGADKAVEAIKTARTTGKKIADVTSNGTVDGCLCLGSAQEVTVSVTRKENLFDSC